MLLFDAWKNICTYLNGIFDFINQNTRDYDNDKIEIVCNTSGYFDPQKGTLQLGNAVNDATGTNTLNKISFSVNLLDKNGTIRQREEAGKSQDMSYSFVWKFDNEASWLYDFKDLITNENLVLHG